MNRKFRGLKAKDEQDPSLLIRDTRPIMKKIADFMRNPSAMLVMQCVIIGLYFLSSHLVDLYFVFSVLCYVCPVCVRRALPFRMPMRSKSTDYNDLMPGTNKPKKAGGIFFIGNEKDTNEELWLTNEDMRTHMLIFGSTGSGKTEALISLAYNALIQSSGFIYVDGKGDNSLFAKVFSIVRFMGRLEDLLLVNFMTGARDIIGPQKKRLSNTLNPFATGSSGMLSQLVVSMMDSSAATPDGDMWKGRAIAFVEALMRVLVCMRDTGQILLDAHTIRCYFALDRVEAMVIDKVFIRDGLQPVSMENLPETVLQPMTIYLETLPGYQRSRRGKQVSQVFEQHGFIVMQLVRVFTSLADTYGHILRTKLAEVDLKDVVLNRRILVTLLPALEKSPDELSNLGKVIIASLKVMMAAGLGDEVEGDFHDLVTRKPTNAKTPYLCILDEYGYYAVQGFAVVPAQARSLGFSVVFAGQDLPAFQKVSKEEAASIGANTNVKICMKLEDPTETWDFFMKTAGESYVAHISGFQANAGNISNSYLDTRGASLEKRARVNLLDLKDQVEGDAHIFFKSKIVLARMFYANPPEVKAMRLNQFLKVDVPPDAQLYVIAKGFEDFEELAKASHKSIDAECGQLIDRVVAMFRQRAEQPPIEKALSALLTLHQDSYEGADDASSVQIAEQELNIFMGIQLPEKLSYAVSSEETKLLSHPLLDRSTVKDQLHDVSCLLGETEQNSDYVVDELLYTIVDVTRYPPAIPKVPTGGHLAEKTLELVQAISLKKEEKQHDPKETKK